MMDTGVPRCKSCGIVFDDLIGEIDKCARKRLYCELCLAQKNPWSATEQKIKKRYLLVASVTALVVLAALIAMNWGRTRNAGVLEYVLVFGFGYAIIWTFTAILLLPVLLAMKKPHKAQIRKEKDKYVEDMEVMKQTRNTLPEKPARADGGEAGGARLAR